MKTLIAFIFLALFVSNLSHAAVTVNCRHVTSVWGSIELTFSTHMDRVEVTVINPFGNLDGSGFLKCEGPIQSAYRCTGKLKLISDPSHSAVLVVSESFFQTTPIKGKLNFDGVDFNCQ